MAANDDYEGYAAVAVEVEIEAAREHGHRRQRQLVPFTVRVLSNVLSMWLARSVVSPHGHAAAAALSLCGLMSCVCTTWRDSVREMLGQVAAQLAPGLLGLGPTSWSTLQQRPWTLQLRLVVRRVRLVQMWANVQGLRGLCMLVNAGTAEAGADSVTKVSYCTWALSRETVLKWLTQLFEFAAVGSVASLGGNVDGGVNADEIGRARHAIVVSFASAVADRLSLEPYADAVRAYPPAAMARFWHGYRAEVDGLRTHIASLASSAWQRVALDAALPLHDAWGAPLSESSSISVCSCTGLIKHFSMQHSDLARICQHSDPRVSMSLEGAARDRTRASIRKVLRRVCTAEFARDEEQPEHEQTEMLDDSVLLDIIGKDWLLQQLRGRRRLQRSRLRLQSQASLEEEDKEEDKEEDEMTVFNALRPRFRDPVVFACVKLWELSTRTQSFVSASSVALAASVAREAGISRDTTTDNAVRLCLHGLPLLGSGWPECSSRKMPLAVLTPARDISHLKSPPTTTVRSKGLVDMRNALSGPEHCRSSVVRTLTRDVQRVWRQAAGLHRAGLPLVVAEPAAVGSSNSGGVDLSTWRGMMQGPRDTPWEAGRFEFEIRIPLEAYPHKPPVLRFLPVITMQGHTTCCVFHPNVDERGFVCADVLATEWSSVCSIATLLLSVQSILDDPSCEHPANVNAAALLVQDRAKYIEKVRALSCATAQRGSKLSTTADFSEI